MTRAALRARVCLAEQLDRVVVVPDAGTDRHDLARELRAIVGRVAPGAGGVSVRGEHAAPLLDPSSHVVLDWDEAARRFVENRRRASMEHTRVRTEVEAVKAAGPEVARRALRDLDDLEVLDPHQLVNVAAMVVPGGPGLCVFDEQGAGKTVTLIFAFDLLAKRHEADVLLVVAPKSMVPEWPRDFSRFTGDLYRVVVLSGSCREKMAALRRGGDVFVTNFETVVSMEAELTSLARMRDGRVVLAVDESFYVKNLDARRTKAVRRLREWCGRAYVLCGTPAPNSPHDLIQQFGVVDFGVTFAGVEVPEERAAAHPVVQQAIEARGLYVRHLKQDVMPDLPGKSFERVLVPLQPQQQQLYDTACRDMVLDLQSIDDAAFQRQLPSFLARRMALLQICSHPGAVVPGYRETPAKLLALDAVLEELIERRGEKVIVWSAFVHSVEELVARYSRYGSVRYDGSVETVEERREAVRRFQEDDQTRVFVANPAAAGAGLTLHRARVAVYESLSNQAAHYLQSLDRIHRRGQAREVQYIVLLGAGTLEEGEYQGLLRKEERAQHLLGDQVVAPPTRQRMLAELLGAGGDAVRRP